VIILDWNIFFSSVSQVTGIIIAFWGAFVVTKLLSNESDYKKNVSKIQSLFNISHSLLMRTLAINYEAYNLNKRYEALLELKKCIVNSEINSIEEYYFKLKFSWYDDRESIFNLLKEILENTDNNNSDGASKEEINLRLEKKLEIYKAYNYSNNSMNEITINVHKTFVEVYENTNKIYFMIKYLKSNPESSKIIHWSLITISILFCVGVIFPMCIIPINTNICIKDVDSLISQISFIGVLFSFKGLILCLITIPFLVLILYLLIQNWKLKYKAKSIETLESYAEKGDYNKYLKYWEDNNMYYKDSTYYKSRKNIIEEAK
jgi:hypothetical protein